MDTDDYITQCVKILSDETTYRKATSYPTQDTQRALTNTITKFKPTLTMYNKQQYNHFTPSHTHHQTPRFYGIPKIHKQFTKLPPLRPIVSHCNSLLAPSAQLLDHTLQPLAQSYPNYIQNSTALSLILKDLQVRTRQSSTSSDRRSLPLPLHPTDRVPQHHLRGNVQQTTPTPPQPKPTDPTTTHQRKPQLLRVRNQYLPIDQRHGNGSSIFTNNRQHIHVNNTTTLLENTTTTSTKTLHRRHHYDNME